MSEIITLSLHLGYFNVKYISFVIKYAKCTCFSQGAESAEQGSGLFFISGGWLQLKLGWVEVRCWAQLCALQTVPAKAWASA